MLGKMIMISFLKKKLIIIEKDQNVIDKNEIVNVEQELVTTNNVNTIIAHTIKFL